MPEKIFTIKSDNFSKTTDSTFSNKSKLKFNTEEKRERVSSNYSSEKETHHIFSDSKAVKKYSVDRRGSIELLRRSRFNSRADDLKTIMSNTETQDLMNELVSILGADLQFYQCFKLVEEEFNIIKYKTEVFIEEWNKNNNIQEKEFFLMIEEVPCEKFISVGHTLEFMFSMNTKDANSIVEILLHFFDKQVIDKEDIKHG